MNVTLTEKTIKIINGLEEEGNIEAKLRKLLRNELVRRLNKYMLIDQTLSQKYKLGFLNFKKKKTVSKKGYSFDVEQDFWDWEMALDGIETIKTKLK